MQRWFLRKRKGITRIAIGTGESVRIRESEGVAYSRRGLERRGKEGRKEKRNDPIAKDNQDIEGIRNGEVFSWP